MPKGHPFRLAERQQRAHLVHHVVPDLRRGGRHLPPPETHEVREGGVRPDGDIVSFASFTVRCIVDGSEAWKPHATFAEEISGINCASCPMSYLPNPSPMSQFRSIRTRSPPAARVRG